MVREDAQLSEHFIEDLSFQQDERLKSRFFYLNEQFLQAFLHGGIFISRCSNKKKLIIKKTAPNEQGFSGKHSKGMIQLVCITSSNFQMTYIIPMDLLYFVLY